MRRRGPPISQLSLAGLGRAVISLVVLAERAAFLRPDSALLIAMLSDENDCSIVDENGSQGWLVGHKGGVGKLNFDMPRATSACANPNDPCCMPCTSSSSIGCPDPSYGYNPALEAMGNRVRASFTAACEPSELPVDSDDRTTIALFETRPSVSDYRCDAPGRSDVNSSDPTLAANLASFVAASGLDPSTACTCEIVQLSGSDLAACRSSAALPANLHGFCYVDPGAGLGDAALVRGCPADAPQRLRFVGDGVPAANALIWRTTSNALTP